MSPTEENELICERLLAWIRVDSPGTTLGQAWRERGSDPRSYAIHRTPAFMNWAEAGLLIDAMTARHCREFKTDSQRITFEWNRACYATLPEGIRASALAYALTLTAICKSCGAYVDRNRGHDCPRLHLQ